MLFIITTRLDFLSVIGKYRPFKNNLYMESIYLKRNFYTKLSLEFFAPAQKGKTSFTI